MHRTFGYAIVLVALLAGACGSAGTSVDAHGDSTSTSTPAATTADPKVAGADVTKFGDDLFAAVRAQATGNVVVSPMSVAVALAMLEPGATGSAKTQIDAALHMDDPAAFHASMAALRSDLESAKPGPPIDGRSQGDLQIALANAAYLQAGYPVRPSYTAALARYYGPLLQTVDFKHDAKGAVDDINKFVADGTHGHIAKILDSLPTDTVLALVNALFLKASWFTPFDPKTTTTESFTRLDGSKADVKMMHGSTFRSLTGDGWVAGSDRYTGSLLVDFVLPDAGQFDAVGNKLGSVFDDLSQHGSDGGELGLPRFTTRFSTELTPAFTKLGITAPYAGGGLLGIADDDSLAVDKVIHATYLTMNEQGTEAAAATIITAVATSGRAGPPPVPVILDRPFYFRIADSNTGATLFIGQVLDPKAS